MADRKLVVVGGGGVRGPLFVEIAAARAERIALSEICLLDTDPEKLRLLGAISRQLAASQVRVTTTTCAQDAFTGADFVVTTIRSGGERGRVLDERIALGHGVLGQETTGPGGFAMALRSIPAILDYARLLFSINPDAWLFNFTNPAGMVTQALRDAGFARTIGICDSANLAQRAVADYHAMAPNLLRPEVFGLNHLSWARAVRTTDGVDLLAPLLTDPSFRGRTSQRFFAPSLVALIGMWINEYLYYYYYAEEAVQRILSEPRTRGEEVLERNRKLLDRLANLDDPEAALAVYREYEKGRRSTYMHYAGSRASGRPLGEGTEGYAGVALDLMESLTGGEPRYTALNIPSQGAIDGMADDDIVEVSAVVSEEGPRPVRIGAIPVTQQSLMRSVKKYERLAVAATSERSRALAVQALMVHPLVLSYPRAQSLVNEYLEAHAALAGEWS